MKEREGYSTFRRGKKKGRRSEEKKKNFKNGKEK